MNPDDILPSPQSSTGHANEREDAATSDAGLSTDSEVDSVKNAAMMHMFGKSGLGRKGRKQSMPIRYKIKAGLYTDEPESPAIKEEDDTATDVGYNSHASSSSEHGGTVGSDDLEAKVEDLSDSIASSPVSTVQGLLTETSGPRSDGDRGSEEAADFSTGRVFPNGPTGGRIFNLDAYCELCNREFCNKYFLKTHKANKHGIYDADYAEATQKTESSQKSSRSLENEAGSSRDSSMPKDSPGPESFPPGLLEQQMLAQQLTAYYMQSWAMQQMMQSGMMPMMPPHLPIFPAVPTALPMFSSAFGVPETRPEVKKSSSEGSMNSPATSTAKDTPPTSGIMCHICNKQLSSRNFLRKHLRKKHDLTEEENRPIKREDSQTASASTAPRSLDLSNTRKVPETSSMPVPHPLLMSRSTQPPNMGLDANLRPPFLCNQCHKEFASPFFLLNHINTEHSRVGKHSTDVEMQDESGVLDLSVSTKKSKPIASPESVSSGGQENSNGRELNPNCIDLDSCCMKCSREYCSKYFLRTHLQKVHNLTREEYLMEVSKNHPEVYQRFMTNPTQNTTGGAGNSDGSSTPTRRNWCRHCQRDFCNKYFFRTHMLKMHGEMVAQSSSGRNGRKRSTGVICDVCNKEYCSKYFLKIHKRNAHGIGDSPSLASDPSGSEHGLPTMQPRASFNSPLASMGFSTSPMRDDEMMRSDDDDDEKMETESGDISLAGSLNEHDRNGSVSPKPTQLFPSYPVPVLSAMVN